MKDLNYYKNNCEEDYIKTPISVLRYITELEKNNETKQLTLTDVAYSGFYCMDAENSNGSCHCPKQCRTCVGY